MAERAEYLIPQHLAGKLKVVSSKDDRTSDEILSSIKAPTSVTSERNVWAFWHSGIDNMPAWTKRNVVNWARLLGPEWTIRILDPIKSSPSNALNFVTPSMLPSAFVEGQMTGDYVGPHSADLVKGACLFLHGGVWLDVGILLFRHLDAICWSALCDPDMPYEVATTHAYAQIVNNHFVAARKGSPFIQRWHQLFCALWRDGRTNFKGMASDPLLAALLPALGRPKAPEEAAKEKRYKFEYSVSFTEILEYVSQVLSWMRVCLLDCPEKDPSGMSGRKYWEEKVLLLDSIDESWSAEEMTGFDTQKIFDLLATRFDDPNTTRVEEAKHLTWRLLESASMQKIYHGKKLLKTPAVGQLWDSAGNGEADCAKGTFAALLRYGSVHFEQIRDLPIVKAPKVHDQDILHVGYLDPA
ncbi:MAG: hypothetical protein M1822_005562 [Bathelium mastoideum]|nr:MAG: hypothetical protein M1822_005562 [Bathelium mastoideum]